MAIERYSGTVVENASASTTLNVPYPTTAPGGILSTDLLVLTSFVNSFNPITNPSGYTLHIESAAATASPTTSCRSKQAAGGETGNLTITTPSATSRAQLHVLRGVDLANVLAATPTEIERGSGNTNYNIPGQTMPTTDCLLMYGAAANTTSGTWSTPSVPAAFTELWDDTTPSPHSALGVLLWTGSGATGTIDLTRSSSIRGGAWMVAFRPSAGTTQHPLTGTVAASSGGSGSIALRAGVAGTVAAVTAVTGAITGLYPLTGTNTSTTTATGTPTARLGLTGTTAATSAATGSPTALKPLTGTVAATSGTVGDIGSQSGTTQQPLDGTVAATTGTSGTIGLRAALAGTVAATSDTTGTPTALLGMAGQVDATSDTSGDPTALVGLSGTIDAVSDTNGAIDVQAGTEQPDDGAHGTLHIARVQGGLAITRARGHLTVTRARATLSSEE